VASGYDLIRVRVNSINENYLDTVDTETYYQPVEIANNKKGTEVARMLYSNDTIKQRRSTIDPKDIMVGDPNSKIVPPKPINILIPEGFRDALSMDTKTDARLCVNFVVNQACSLPYEVNILGMITKIPGFFFMSYR
jgi:hypothetical protein